MWAGALAVLKRFVDQFEAVALLFEVQEEGVGVVGIGVLGTV